MSKSGASAPYGQNLAACRRISYDPRVPRWGWLTLLACARLAHADPRFEASGFVGVDYFGTKSQLGNSTDPTQVPGTAPLLGGRVGYLVFPDLWSGHLQLGVEGELGIAAAYTGYAHSGSGDSFFAPVFEWHAHALLRLTGDSGILGAVRPHLVAGGGGETVASSSPLMQKETDPVFYAGLGLTAPVMTDWQLRVDAREGLMPARGGGETATFELQFGVSTSFGLPVTHVAGTRHAMPVVRDDRDVDTDGDGIPDRLDKCPTQRETVNGVEDDDGCPEPDPDGDGLVGADDKCPDQPEDFDGFQDQDGCPDPDNDMDGIPDTADACPNEPETRNGFQDEDGCPDVVPPEVTTALAAAKGLRFEAGRARLSDAAKQALAPIVAMLVTYHSMRIAVVGHPERAKDDDLARRRADTVKWYLVDQGFAEDRLEVRVGEVLKTPAIHVELIVSPPRP